jgi:thiamine pyrophosphokinase
MPRYAILLGGDVTVTERLSEQIAGCRVIAADSGMAHAAALGLQVELWVGDFDSAGTALEQAYAGVPRSVYPAEKDATDGEIAVTEALKRGATSLVLVGGLGGQFDHVLAHGVMMLALSSRGLPVFSTSGHEEAYPLVEELMLKDLPHGTRVSVVGVTDIKGISIEGVKWPLTKKDVPLGSSLTLSNESAGDVRLSLMRGQALVMVYPR